jgi:hypothetical protein
MSFIAAIAVPDVRSIPIDDLNCETPKIRIDNLRINLRNHRSRIISRHSDGVHQSSCKGHFVHRGRTALQRGERKGLHRLLGIKRVIVVYRQCKRRAVVCLV